MSNDRADALSSAVSSQDIGPHLLAQIKRADHAEDRLTDALAALVRAREDINWMLNNRQFLNAHVFTYIDAALSQATAKQERSS